MKGWLLSYMRSQLSKGEQVLNIKWALGTVKERVLINGAIVENGDRRSRLSIMTPNTNILRLRDAIHPEEANTPVRRVCYALQLVLSGDSDPKEVHHNLMRQVEELSQVFTDTDSRSLLSQATDNLVEGQVYQALALGQLEKVDELRSAWGFGGFRKLLVVS